METNGGNTAGKRRGEAQPDNERLTGSIAMGAFSCRICSQPLRPPIFQCPVGHFFCLSCRDNLPENKCQFCSRCALQRSYGMELAVESILLNCCYAKRGCTAKTTYYSKDEHEKACQHAPCLCPVPGCGFSGRHKELLHHLTAGHHKWPLTKFRYRAPFDLRVVEPGTHVLHTEDDEQLFLLSVRPAAEPAGLAVSLVFVPPYLEATRFGCTVSFSCFSRHRSTWTLDDLQPLQLSDWPPTECICVVPKVSSGGNDDASVVLTITIFCDEPEWDDEDYTPYDNGFLESDEDDSDSS